MYCKNCGFHSFDYLKTCPKCGQNLEKSRKDLRVQWLEETKGNWLDATKEEKTDEPENSHGTEPSANQKDTTPHKSEDEFMLEENWAITTSEQSKKEASSQENFIIEDEPPQKPVQVTPDVPVPSSDKPRPEREITVEMQEPPVDDLLIPGLEEMLQAAAQSAHKDSAPRYEQDLSNTPLPVMGTKGAAPIEVSLGSIGNEKIEEKKGQDIFPSPQDMDLDQDIVEIDLDDLQLSLEKKSESPTEKATKDSNE